MNSESIDRLYGSRTGTFGHPLWRRGLAAFPFDSGASPLEDVIG